MYLRYIRGTCAHARVPGQVRCHTANIALLANGGGFGGLSNLRNDSENDVLR
jgi:hypothetical protein